MDRLDHLVHLLLGLPHCQAADGIAAAVVVIQTQCMLHGLLPELRIDAALDDRKHRLAVTVKRLRLVEMLCEALQPALGKPEGFLRIGIIRVARTALVEGHHDVGADDALGVDVVLRSEGMAGTVDVRREGAAVRRQLADGAEGEYLETAAVGEDRAVPSLEAVQAAGLPEDAEPGAQIEVISIAEDDLGPDIFLQIPMVHALDAAHRADGHEDGRTDLPVVGGDHA